MSSKIAVVTDSNASMTVAEGEELGISHDGHGVVVGPINDSTIIFAKDGAGIRGKTQISDSHRHGSVAAVNGLGDGIIVIIEGIAAIFIKMNGLSEPFELDIVIASVVEGFGVAKAFVYCEVQCDDAVATVLVGIGSDVGSGFVVVVA